MLLVKTNGMSAPPPARPRRRAISLSTETPEKLLCSRSDHSCDCAARAREKKGARSSIEALLKRASGGREVGSINPLVDIYNTVSLTYALPCGGEDIDTFAGDLRLTVTQGGDAFRALGDEADSETLPGEVCYLDDAGAVCRCWNWRDGVRTALSDDSADAFLAIECVEPERMGDCQAAIDRLAELLERYLGATVVVKTLVTRDNPRVEL